MRYKTLTYNEVTHDVASKNHRCTLEDGLERLREEGWELVTSFQLTDSYNPSFVFRERSPR